MGSWLLEQRVAEFSSLRGGLPMCCRLPGVKVQGELGRQLRAFGEGAVQQSRTATTSSEPGSMGPLQTETSQVEAHTLLARKNRQTKGQGFESPWLYKIAG
jgi:hypothetical protein